jgi:hypothetical protein
LVGGLSHISDRKIAGNVRDRIRNGDRRIGQGGGIEIREENKRQSRTACCHPSTP